MPDKNPTQHSVNYIEFTVTDMQKTKNFYSKAFDWQFTDYNPAYVGVKNEDGEFGGFELVNKVDKGGPLVILYSHDLEDSLSLVQGAGGKITKDIFEFPGGRRFEFEDPSENKLSVWSKKDS